MPWKYEENSIFSTQFGSYITKNFRLRRAFLFSWFRFSIHCYYTNWCNGTTSSKNAVWFCGSTNSKWYVCHLRKQLSRTAAKRMRSVFTNSRWCVYYLGKRFYRRCFKTVSRIELYFPRIIDQHDRIHNVSNESLARKKHTNNVSNEFHLQM